MGGCVSVGEKKRSGHQRAAQLERMSVGTGASGGRRYLNVPEVRMPRSPSGWAAFLGALAQLQRVTAELQAETRGKSSRTQVTAVPVVPSQSAIDARVPVATRYMPVAGLRCSRQRGR